MTITILITAVIMFAAAVPMIVLIERKGREIERYINSFDLYKVKN